MSIARMVLAALIAGGSFACSGSSSPVPAPTAPPSVQPVYPNMIGGWNGTLTINATIVGVNASNACAESWIITGQSNGDFSGTFQLTGGTTTPCAQSGSVSGTVTTSGTVSAGHSVTIGISLNCVRISGDGVYSGVVSGTS
jgi:hypothetical protein